jgi:energy-coupling factor transporter ATP-binding protein EcfA2
METTSRRPIAGPSVNTHRRIEIGVPRAGVVGLTGPNGAGKSVILMAVAGVEPVAQVGVEWAAAPSPPPIAALQFPDLQIFQEDVSDEMAFASVARGVPRNEALARVRELLDQAGMEPGSLIGRRTWGLAAGEKRIMEVVAALAAPSCLYLLDEPTAGLDPVHRYAMMEVIHRMGSSNSIVLASQDRDWLAGMGCPVVEIDPAMPPKPPDKLEKPLTRPKSIR